MCIDHHPTDDYDYDGCQQQCRRSQESIAMTGELTSPRPAIRRRPSQALALLTLLSTLAFAAAYVTYLVRANETASVSFFAAGVLVFTTFVEIAAGFYCFAHLYASLAYLLARDPVVSPGTIPARPASLPSVGVIYLCCNDLDPQALRSLAGLKYDGELHLIVHDDSVSPEAQGAVDSLVAELRERGRSVLLLRRPKKGGGKPGVMNYVLDQSGRLYDYFLVCDNDSTVLDPYVLGKALLHFSDERVAVVQGRSVAVDSSDYGQVNRLLSRSIDAFHLFLSVNARFGWSAFIGHNAVLRTRVVREAGGFTPGFFSDDLDLTVRLNLRGYAVAYAPEVRLGEKHPPSYAAFRKRAYKWAYGCVQTLRAHAFPVLATLQLSLAEKVGFFQFACFFVLQAVLLLYLAVKFVLAPLCLGPQAFPLLTAAIAGAAVIVAIFLPITAYFLKERTLARSACSMLMCGLVYGTADFCSARGVWDCLCGRKRSWVPTNQPVSRPTRSGLDLEALFGVLLLAIPMLLHPALLLLPTTPLFAGKFLFGPALAVLYDDRCRRAVAGRRPRRWLALAAASVAVVFAPGLLLFDEGATGGGSPPGGAAVEVRGKNLHVGGRPFLVKGMHYGPWRPGTGPGKHYPYPSREDIDQDLRRIRDLNVNTILVYDAPDYVLDLSHQYGLKVIYTFYINWKTFGRPEAESARAAIVKKVEELREKPALLVWVLGNEIPAAAIAQRGEKAFHDGLESLYRAVKEADSRHPVTHSNWPPTKELDLRFLDLVGFNVYPLWPPEVVAAGYGNYIREVLEPLAGDRPLLVTEFGVNTIEASEAAQSRIVKQCWRDIRGTGACGGVVLEFADEWWKNYDNPRRVGSWWDRVDAFDDEQRHDLDPEEHYGILTGDRRPKLAAAEVREMFSATDEPPEPGTAPPGDRNARTVAAVVVTLLVFLAVGAWLRANRGFWTREPANGGPDAPADSL
jgi:hypothetical protein